MAKEEKMDLSVGGPNSPISLRKFLDSEGDSLSSLTILVDGSGCGIDVDNAPVLTISPEDCAMQAQYFRDTFFNEHTLPKYILYDFSIFYKSEMEDLDEIGKIAFVSNLIKYLQPEAKQILGLIILVRGSVSMAAKQGKTIRFYIQHPETYLHPKRQSAFSSWLVPIINPLAALPSTKIEEI